MRIIITGRNIELTPGLKEAVEDKLSKLEKYFKPDTDVNVTLSVEKDRQKIEVTIPTKGHTIRAEEVSNDMYVSIDLVEEIIERQLRKYKNKIVDSKQAAPEFSSYYVSNDYVEDEPEITSPSKGTLSPGFTITMSPISTSSTFTAVPANGEANTLPVTNIFVGKDGKYFVTVSDGVVHQSDLPKYPFSIFVAPSPSRLPHMKPFPHIHPNDNHTQQNF
mgnify:CR=1 FL=1